ncbi:DUF4129 domain-containing protein [bacterium]|nr:DUF4129 domain-containing protein [bacterium]
MNSQPSSPQSANWQKYTGHSSGRGSAQRHKDTLVKKFQRLRGFLTGIFPNVENSVGLRLSVYLCELTSLIAAFTLLENLGGLLIYAILLTLGSLFAFFSRHTNSCLVKLCITVGMLWVLLQFIQNLAASPYDTRDSAALLLSGLLMCHSFDTPRRRDLDYSLTVSLLLISYSAVMSASFSFVFILLAYLCCIVSALYFRCLSSAQENAVPVVTAAPAESAERSFLPHSPLRLCAYFLLTILAVNIVFITMPRFGNLSFFKLQHRFNLNLDRDKKEEAESGGGGSKNAKLQASRVLDGGLRAFADEDDISTNAPPNSDRLIMKVKTNQQTYYRGLAFSNYDGRKWRLGNKDLTEWPSGQPMQVITGPNNPYCIKPLVQIFYVEADMPNLIFAAFQPYNTAFPYGSFYIDKDSVMRAPAIIEAGSVYTVYSIPPYAEPYVRHSQSSPYINASSLPEEREALQYLQGLSPYQETDGGFLGCSGTDCYFDFGDDSSQNADNTREEQHNGGASYEPSRNFNLFSDSALPDENDLLRHLQYQYFRTSYRKNRDKITEQRRQYTDKLIRESKGAYFFRRDKHPRHMRKMFQEYRQLPPQISPRIKALAHFLTHRQPSDYLKALAISHFLRANCVYQNPPPICPEDREPVDYFLFTSQKGNCRQFASAMTLLCRAANLPARYINGYAPGRYNPFTMTYEVREYDAHAWTEVMIPMLGWVSYDATSPHAADNGSGTASEQPVMFFYRQDHSIAEDIRKYLSQFISDDLKAAASGFLYLCTDLLKVMLPAAAAAVLLYMLFLSCQWLNKNCKALRESFFRAKEAEGGLRGKISSFIFTLRLNSYSEESNEKGALSRYRLMLSRLKALNINKKPSHTPREFAESVKAEPLNVSVQALTKLYEKAYYGASALAADERRSAAVDEEAEKIWQKLKKDIAECELQNSSGQDYRPASSSDQSRIT